MNEQQINLGMRKIDMFGLKIISKSNYENLVKSEIKFQKVIQCHRWFAGWRDLDIIWDYIIQDINYGGIEKSRKDYANARKTDEYGNKI